ncbi:MULTISPECIES: hypothetical protein [Rhizobium]|uniref:hypothetical protein n=1 Tax=Rhizobium TaxID=379 RepID=UPI001C82CB63|nr:MULTISPECIES: hypothetical protein [Rhizobium]MBX4952075.1 hypothetical protein [Rhizobium binae]MBX5226854.1 hypothetical protein [Rhizobium sp. NLR9b]MBX5238176.1 hypothetical protein [Rhizobium sp. NLR22b]MBX5276097.1 hypothetical protein [Rhizobium sp. NLR13a]MBX5287525.1 hypothetical protein [Rhizobium sp. NLR10b]
MPNMKTAAGEAMPKVPPTDAEIISAFRDLEHEICCLNHMTDILADLLDDQLVPMETRGNDALMIMLTKYQLETLSFAWNDVSFRATRVRDAFYAAGEGEMIR